MKLFWNPPKITKNLGRYTYDIHYAALVHEGGDSSQVHYPARSWTDRAAAEADVEAKFAEFYQQTGNLDAAFNLLVDWFAGQMQDKLMSAEWAWPHITLRENGDVAGLIRDIFDMGELYRSLQVEVTK
ncbi:MAG: hypothetical protein AAFY20_09365 [Cyanobacteria bacterium J06639_14]